jgi:hypothetical protein
MMIAFVNEVVLVVSDSACVLLFCALPKFQTATRHVCCDACLFNRYQQLGCHGCAVNRQATQPRQFRLVQSFSTLQQ